MSPSKAANKEQQHEHYEQASPYEIIIWQDDALVAVLHFESAILAVETWQRFTDYGDAVKYRQVHFHGAAGESVTKYFSAQ